MAGIGCGNLDLACGIHHEVIVRLVPVFHVDNGPAARAVRGNRVGTSSRLIVVDRTVVADGLDTSELPSTIAVDHSNAVLVKPAGIVTVDEDSVLTLDRRI